MDEFFRNAPKIIEESAKNPLALVALIILALSFLGLFYFRDASELTRIVIFLFMGFGALMLVAILFSQSPVYKQNL
jgi:FtsH-binding integral membrane protein